VIAYLDSSVLLRVVLGQRDSLKEWGRVTQGIASALAEVVIRNHAIGSFSGVTNRVRDARAFRSRFGN